MKYCIPGELWNQVEAPVHGQTPTLVSTYLSEMAYKLPSITDVMMAKEFWHTLCEFAERCGALRERVTGQISAAALDLVVTTPVYGEFQRFVGAGVDSIPVGFEKFSANIGAEGPVISFDAACCPENAGNEAKFAVYADISVIPDVNARPENQKAPIWFLKKFDRALLSGTLMRLYAMAREPWTDEAAARMNATTYRQEVNRVTHGLVTAGMRKQMLVDAESVLARQSVTVASQTSSQTVG